MDKPETREQHQYRIAYAAGYMARKRGEARRAGEPWDEQLAENFSKFTELVDTLSLVLTRYTAPANDAAWDVLNKHLGNLTPPTALVRRRICKGSIIKYIDSKGCEVSGVLQEFVKHVPPKNEQWKVQPVRGGDVVSVLVDGTMVTRFGPMRRPRTKKGY